MSSSTSRLNQSKKGLGHKVNELVRKYLKVTQPSAVLRDILRKPEESSLLFRALRRQVALVKCRSQDLEDSQVTIYDQALLVLTGYGDSLADIRALELYLTEFLGVVPIAPFSQSRDILSKHIDLQNVLANASGSAGAQGRTAPRDDYSQGHMIQQETSIASRHEPNGIRYGTHHGEDRVMADRSPPRTDQQVHEQAEKLLLVYYRARDEYYNRMQRDGVVDMSTVRFLRDTAENVLLYLRNSGLSQHPAIPDLEEVFAVARDKASQLSGGRKRHFDEGSSRSRRKRARRNIDSYRPNA